MGISKVLFTFSLITTILKVQSSLFDVTSDVFRTDHPTGVLAAFGDYNADKATDIFILSENGKSLFVLEADMNIQHEGTRFNNITFHVGEDYETAIVNIVPGDFSGDSQMDVLVMRKANQEQESTEVKVEFYYGNGSLFATVNETFRDQPIVIDGNGDMTPDVFGETVDGKRMLWIFATNGSYTMVEYQKENGEKCDPLRKPQSSAFLDLNGDLTADLCAVSEVNKTVKFEFWYNKDGNLKYSHSVLAPPELKVVGQASFVDLDGNHETNIVLPGCIDSNCNDSAVFVWAQIMGDGEGKWHRLDVNFQDYKVSFPQIEKPLNWLTLPLTLRMGDFNLDGYPDAIVVLSDSTGSASTFLMYNVECGTRCQNFSRTFSIDSRQSFQNYKPALATFFDLMENGVLDILITEFHDGSPVIRAIQQDFTGDASFLKVMVVSGLCQKNCPDGHSPYGVNQVGPTARFESTTPTGNDQIGVASQLSQSSYFSLQLPFMLFGLGQTPNFVDELQVGIPSQAEKPRSHSWSSIIPNSQVIVIPYPIQDPERWKLELYVTPSRLVLLTGTSLLGTCAFIAIIVGLFQWREKMEDKKEKLQEAQRFHFDAM